MGVMRFIVSPPDRIREDKVEQAYLTGFDRTPWVVRSRSEKDQVVIERAESDSVNLHIPWEVDGHGRVTIATGSLIESGQPYHLPLELARGKLAQLRNQLSEWQLGGLRVPVRAAVKAAEARDLFGRAGVGQDDPAISCRLAEAALRVALDAADLLVAVYVDHALGVRHRVNHRIPVHLAGELGASPLDEPSAAAFLQAFNAACVPLCWREIESDEGTYLWDVSDRQVEWCHAQSLPIYGGPLVQWDRRRLPGWLYAWQGDFEAVVSSACEYVTAAVTRYRGQVDFWHCAGRLNSAEISALSEEENLRLAARIIELGHALDPATPVILSVDQPWGEYLSRREMDFPPLQFADALARAGLGLSGLMLELNVGYYPGGTALRDPMEFSRQLDFWSIVGLPLHISVCTPSASNADPLAQRPVKLLPDSADVKTQQAWVGRYVPVLLAKPYIQGIVWTQFRAFAPHDFPHGGLLDLRRHPKPALRTLASIRRAHLR